MRLKMKSVVIAACAAVAAPAFAAPSPTLYGGGATLPAIGYVGNSWLAPTPDNRLSSQGDVGSLFALYSALDPNNPKVSYCQTGSGTGRGVITGANQGTGSCPTYASSPTGFAAPTADAHFGASDAPISASEFNLGVTNKGATRGQPVQFPATAGAIAIIYNNNQVVKKNGAPEQLNLTESQICQIWAGQITNWSELGRPAKPIKLVYRSDSSGTSFGFSNHLSYVCPNPTYAAPTTVSGFSTQSTFANAFVGGSSAVPAGAIAASGNGGVTAAVNANDGAIGYAEVANAVQVAKLDPTAAVKFASVSLKAGGKKKSPDKNPKAFKIAASAVNVDKVLGSNDANGRPTLTALTAPNPGCVFVVDPAAYATSILEAGDYKQYPIVAVSYLLGYYKGYGEDVTNVRNFFAAPYNPAVKTPTVPEGTELFIGAKTGLSFLGGVNLKNNIIGTKKAPAACINP